MASCLHIPMEECSWDKDHPQDEEEQANNVYWHIPGDCDQVSSVLMSVLTVLDQSVMCALLERQPEVLDFQQCLGSSMVGEGEYLMSNNGEGDDSSMGDKSGSDTITSSQEDDLIQQLDDDDIEQIMVSGISAGRLDEVDPKHLAKIWRISDDAKRTIGVTTQHGHWAQEPTLSQNYRTNDWMQDFIMDTFFATSKGGKSSSRSTCCQLFVTDKGYLYVVLMKRKGEVLQVVKQFAKEVGAPDVIISDMVREQLSQEVKHFCNLIGMTLCALDEGTPSSNCVELYIKLMKEEVHKDMREANSPLVFWDYCLECHVRIYNLTAQDHHKSVGLTLYCHNW